MLLPFAETFMLLYACILMQRRLDRMAEFLPILQSLLVAVLLASLPIFFRERSRLLTLRQAPT
jgi:hypothetical protein